jgi:hypothetical protein
MIAEEGSEMLISMEHRTNVWWWVWMYFGPYIVLPLAL